MDITHQEMYTYHNTQLTERIKCRNTCTAHRKCTNVTTESSYGVYKISQNSADRKCPNITTHSSQKVLNIATHAQLTRSVQLSQQTAHRMCTKYHKTLRSPPEVYKSV